MKKYILAIILLFPTICSAWGPYGPGPMGPGYWGIGMPYGGYPYGAYGAMGYGWGIQAPSFNYTTVIQQSPPIVINSPPVVQEFCDSECQRIKSYIKR